MTALAEDSTRQWRVSVALFVPKHVEMPAGGGLPSNLVFQSRMPEQAKELGDISFAVRKGRYSDLSSDPQLEVVELVADVSAGTDPYAAIKKLGPAVEVLVDLVSFEMGVALTVGPTMATDVTPPIMVGEERSFASFASAPFDTSARSVEMQAINGALLGRLPDTAIIDDSKIAAVLRWFVKSLSTNLLHDQFIFLWIALEIQCDASSVKIEEPYACRKGHPIAACPICEAPTTKLVRGATLRAYLEQFGVSKEQSKELWAMRQLMHGAIPFDSDKLSNLGSLLQQLRAVVAAALKEQLGKQPDDPPIVVGEGLSIHPAMAVGGTTVITHDDLSKLST